jgi:hypothetical protein
MEEKSRSLSPAPAMGDSSSDGTSETYIDPVKEGKMMRKFDVSYG